MNLSDLRTNETAEKQGVWIPFMGAEFLIASASAPAYKAALAKHSKDTSPHLLRANPSIGENIARRAMADAVLLDWRGEVKDGELALDPTNREHRMTLLSVRPFAEWVAEQSTALQNFQDEARRELETDLKSCDPVDA